MATLCSSNPVVGVSLAKSKTALGRKRNAAATRRRVAAARCSSGDVDERAPEVSKSIGVLGRRDAISAAALLSLGFVTPSAARAAALSSPSDGPVLVVGATGATGRRVVAQLLAKGVAVRAGSRDVKKAQVRGATRTHNKNKPRRVFDLPHDYRSPSFESLLQHIVIVVVVVVESLSPNPPPTSVPSSPPSPPFPTQGLGLAAGGAELVQLDVLDPDSIAAAAADVTAIVCATGFTPSLNFRKDNPAQVDHKGTDNLVAAATAPGSSVKKFVLVTSLLTNAKAVGQANNDNYRFLNALGGVLDEKLAAELNLRGSGLDYTIVRPGGLSNEPEAAVGNLIVRGEDTTFGLSTDPGREISRDTVAAVCVEALFSADASKRVVEIVSSPDAPALPAAKWFA